MSGFALVTGAAGFVGRHLVRRLVAKGESVRAIDLAFQPPVDAADSRVASINDTDALADAMRDVHSVFHCAAIPHLWARDKHDFDRINVAGTRKVLEVAKAAGVQRFVHVSSFVTLVATRFSGRMVDETESTQASEMLGAYPLSKHRSERLALEASDKSFEVVAVLPSAPVGAFDYHLTPPSKLTRDLVRGRVPATLDCLMNLIDAEALTEAMIAARDKGRAGERYLLTGPDMRMAEFLAVLEGVSGKSMPKRVVPGSVAYAAAWVEEQLIAPMRGKPPGAPLTGVRLARAGVRFDNNKARRELGLAPPPLENSLGAALEWMRSEGLIDPD
ncbi:MAG: NAD-dependent epimerase/dehydratase family protein [Pseudomonadota bacterium]